MSRSPDILRRILDRKKAEMAAGKRQRSAADLRQTIADLDQPRPFSQALRDAALHGPAVIAEIKKASPSKGLIRRDFDVEALARAYQAGGAACLSVLTDEDFFQGSTENLSIARQASGLPCLRKDFIIDQWQVLESRALGADAVLLICAALEADRLRELVEQSLELGMAALVEVHDATELEMALSTRSTLIGINNRDLHTFETRLETTEVLAPTVDDTHLVVAESGINTPADLHRLARAGAQAFLVGESLMREDDVEAALRKLREG